jgi:hypothetical protein
MATKRPSFLKRQKEMARNARALEKREARKGRKDAKTDGPDDSIAFDSAVRETEIIQDVEP